MTARALVDYVQISPVVADPRSPEEVDADLLRYFEDKIMRLYGPERFDEAMRVFHAARDEYAATRGGQ